MICTQCKQDKNLSEFNTRKDRPKGYQSKCKLCQCDYNNRKNFASITEGVKICVDCNLEKPVLDFFVIKRNKDGRDIRCKNCENKRKIKVLNKYPNIRMIENIRRRTRAVLKGENKSDSTINLIGCSREQLIKHIESMFDENMSWDNYGSWHIDHIKPCSLFDLSDEKQQKECFHYTNLQPLWAKDNLRKSNNYE